LHASRKKNFFNKLFKYFSLFRNEKFLCFGNKILFSASNQKGTAGFIIASKNIGRGYSPKHAQNGRFGSLGTVPTSKTDGGCCPARRVFFSPPIFQNRRFFRQCSNLFQLFSLNIRGIAIDFSAIKILLQKFTKTIITIEFLNKNF